MNKAARITAQPVPKKKGYRRHVTMLMVLLFVTAFCWARQSIEEQQLKFRISTLSEQKMALMDDLRVLQVEVAQLERSSRIDARVRELQLNLIPSAYAPIVIDQDNAPVAAPVAAPLAAEESRMVQAEGGRS